MEKFTLYTIGLFEKVNKMIKLDFLKLFFKSQTAEPKPEPKPKPETKFITGSDNIFRDLGIENADELLVEAESKYGEHDSEKIQTKPKKSKVLAQNKNPDTLKLDHLSKRQLEGIMKSTGLAISFSEDSSEILQLKRTLKVLEKALEKKVGKGGK